MYQPFDNSYYSQELPKNTSYGIQELWLFNLIGGGPGTPPAYFHSQEKPKKVQFAGKTAWEIRGLESGNANKARAFLDAATGELVGWDETSGSPESTKRFRMKSLHWNGKGLPAFALPKNAHKVPLDDFMYLPKGYPFPDIALVDELGKTTTLTRLLSGNSGAVISIGSPGCGPCEASKRFASRNLGEFNSKKVKFVALESWGCSKTDLEKIVRDNPVPFRCYRPSGMDDLQNRLKLAGAPTIYFVDAQRRVIHAQQGFEPKSFAGSLRKLGLGRLKS